MKKKPRVDQKGFEAVKWFPTLKEASSYSKKRKGTFKVRRAGGGFGLYKKKRK